MGKRWVFSLIALSVGLHISGQRVVLKNNLLYDATLTPNLGIETALGQRTSLGVNAGYRPWPSEDEQLGEYKRKYRHLLVAPYLRLWTDSVFHHHFFGITAVYSHYNTSKVHFPFGLYPDVRNDGRQGDLWAAGLSYGYTSRLSRLFRWEAEAGIDVGYTRYHSYDCNHCDRGRDSKPFLMPKLALNIVVDPLHREAEPEPVVQPVTPIIEPKPVPEPYVPHFITPFVEDYQGAADKWRRDNPVLAHVSEYRPYDKTRILRKEKGMLYVHFPLDKTTLLYDFADNGPILDRIVDITRDIMADSTSSVQHIQIVGLASIEGRIAHNQELSDGRANALKHYVQERVSVPDSLFDIYGGGEAWTEFRDQVNDLLATAPTDPASTAPDGSPVGREGGQSGAGSSPLERLGEVLSIIDNEPDANRREARLKRHPAWSYIRDHVLAEQRNSGYVRIYYDYVPDARAKAINDASNLLNAGRYDEALDVLQAVSDDPRAANTLGAVLYNLGRLDEAAAAWQQGADAGNADAALNLREYRRYQENLRQRQEAEEFNRHLSQPPQRGGE